MTDGNLPNWSEKDNLQEWRVSVRINKSMLNGLNATIIL